MLVYRRVSDFSILYPPYCVQYHIYSCQVSVYQNDHHTSSRVWLKFINSENKSSEFPGNVAICIAIGYIFVANEIKNLLLSLKINWNTLQKPQVYSFPNPVPPFIYQSMDGYIFRCWLRPFQLSSTNTLRLKLNHLHKFQGEDQASLKKPSTSMICKL